MGPAESQVRSYGATESQQGHDGDFFPESSSNPEAWARKAECDGGF